MQIVCDFSTADRDRDGFRRDAHIDIRREAQRQTRPRRRSKLHVAAHASVALAPWRWTNDGSIDENSESGRLVLL